MEATTTAFLAAIFLITAATFPAALAHHSPCEGSASAHAPSEALPPRSGFGFMASDGKTVDQGIAYVLMLVALALTYLIH